MSVSVSSSSSAIASLRAGASPATPGETWRASASSSAAVATGLAITPFMPAARNTSAWSGSTWAVTAMTGICPTGGGRARIIRVAASPSMPGICTSISTAS
ncbi:MAG: hypothetical protein MUC89_12075 [Acetobacteraceae bacterium]|nr:hypothetical protein [Acetobacteraceae bacterium]